MATGTAGFALLAGDEGDPFAQEDPLNDSEEVHNSKREPTHRGGIVRRAPREPFGAGNSRGKQWLQRCPTARHHFLWPVRSLEQISAPTAQKKPCTGQLKRRTEPVHEKNCMVSKSQNGVAQRHTCSSEGPLCCRLVKFFRVLRTDLTAHIHATRFVNRS